MNKLLRYNNFLMVEQPNAAISTTLSTRREVLDMKYYYHRGRSDNNNNMMIRERWLVENHLQLLERDMMGTTMMMNEKTASSIVNVPTADSSIINHNNNGNNNNNEKTVVLLWSGTYPIWLAKVRMGNVKNCNIPCEWTRDPNYNIKKHANNNNTTKNRNRNRNSNITALACMMYGKKLCRDITPEALHKFGIEMKNLPILGIDWGNDWRGETKKSAGIDESIPSQLERLQGHVPYNLISSYELDSHIPILYDAIAKFIDNYRISSLDDLLRNQQQHTKKIDSIFFAISNCKASIRPDRLKLIRDLQQYYPASSFGKCLGSARNRNQKWNSRSNRGSNETLVEMGRYRFVYAPENSYGQDYVTEKVYNALQSGSVPIYMGAPNIVSFLPDPDAVIHVSDFESPQALGKYLQELSRNHSLLVNRHLRWRTRPLPDHFVRLSKLTDAKSDYSFACKVCNCVRGRIGCVSVRPSKVSLAFDLNAHRCAPCGSPDSVLLFHYHGS